VGNNPVHSATLPSVSIPNRFIQLAPAPAIDVIPHSVRQRCVDPNENRYNVSLASLQPWRVGVCFLTEAMKFLNSLPAGAGAR